MSTHIDNLWIFALASKCTQENIVYSLLIMALVWLTMNFFYWSHPGGPAWGKYYYSNSNNNKNKNNLKSSPMFIPGPNGYPLIGSMNLMSSSLAHHRLASSANKLASRHHRVTLCEVCEQTPFLVWRSLISRTQVFNDVVKFTSPPKTPLKAPDIVSRQQPPLKPSYELLLSIPKQEMIHSHSYKSFSQYYEILDLESSITLIVKP